MITEQPSKIIVGLGNPGERYARTRHNTGFMAVEALAGRDQSGVWREECRSLVYQTEIAGRRVVLAKPLTFMNLSGQAVQLLLAQYQLDQDDLLLILDDLNLPFGKIRVRPKGSAGGHHGLESVLSTVGSEEILRVRLGIGEEEMNKDKTDFVLANFPRDREAELAEMILRTQEVVKTILADGVCKAMSLHNT